MPSNCVSEQELLMHGVVMREALLRILARYSSVFGVDGQDSELCVRSLGDARLNIGLPPFSGSSLPSPIETTLAQALSDAPRTERTLKFCSPRLNFYYPVAAG